MQICLVDQSKEGPDAYKSNKTGKGLCFVDIACLISHQKKSIVDLCNMGKNAQTLRWPFSEIQQRK